MPISPNCLSRLRYSSSFHVRCMDNSSFLASLMTSLATGRRRGGAKEPPRLLRPPCLDEDHIFIPNGALDTNDIVPLSQGD
jgi:hypothetical protein